MSAFPGSQVRDPHLALFDSLYAAQHRPLYAYLLGAVSDHDAAADLLQEVFLRVWQHRETVAAMPEERRRFWLFRVARNARLDYYRRRGVRATHEQPMAEGDAGEVAALGGLGSTVELDAAIARLPEDLRTVLVMSALGGMDSGEIGAALDRPAGTVRYQLMRARRLLAEELGMCQQETTARE